MEQSSTTAAGVIDTFLVLLIGIGPKIALVPFLQINAPLDPATTQRVARKMLVTAATVAFALIVLGEPLRSLLHFEAGSLSIAGGVILLVLAVQMVIGQGQSGSRLTEGKDPMQLAQLPLAVPYLLNPVGIVGLVTISLRPSRCLCWRPRSPSWWSSCCWTWWCSAGRVASGRRWCASHRAGTLSRWRSPTATAVGQSPTERRRRSSGGDEWASGPGVELLTGALD